MKEEIEKVFVYLLKRYMNLPDNYGTDAQGNVIPTILIRGQNIKLFNTDKLQIAISTISSEVYGNRKEYKQTKTDVLETVYMNEKRVLQIDIFSRNNEARQRLAEVQMALASTFAQELQDKYQFKIGSISSASNLTGVDGGSDVNRYTIRVNCLLWHTKETSINYYDKFRADFYNEQGKIKSIQ